MSWRGHSLQLQDAQLGKTRHAIGGMYCKAQRLDWLHCCSGLTSIDSFFTHNMSRLPLVEYEQ
jgi:hypothetical protein